MNMFAIFILITMAQYGPGAQQLCRDNVDRMQQMLSLIPISGCRWINLIPVPPHALHPTFYDPMTKTCEGNVQCLSPYPEENKTYITLKAYCFMPTPPPGNDCTSGDMTASCRINFIQREYNECDKL